MTLCNPMDCSLPGSSVHGISQARTLEWDCHSLLQGIFPTQGSNLGVLHCRQILYHLRHQKSPWNLGSWLKNEKKKKKKGHWRAKCNKWRKVVPRELIIIHASGMQSKGKRATESACSGKACSWERRPGREGTGVRYSPMYLVFARTFALTPSLSPFLSA